MNPLLAQYAGKILGVLIALAVVAGGAFYQGHHMEAQVFQDYKDKQTAVAAKQVASNQTAVAALTASEAQGLRQIAATAQESRNEIQKRNDALVASNAQLADRLRQRLTATSVAGTVVPSAAAGRPDDHAASDAALSVGLAELVKFNTAQFYAADQLAVSLTAAQQVIREDREICNGKLPGIN